MKKLLVLLISTFYLFNLSAQDSPKKIAVFSSDDKAKTEGFGVVFREILIEKLTKSSNYIPVERDQIDQVLRENKYQETGLVDEDKIKIIGKQLGADYVCISTIVKIGENYFLSAKLVDIETAVVFIQENRETLDGANDLTDNMKLIATSLFESDGTSGSNENGLAQVNKNTEELIDPRDGKRYKTIEIQGKVWMAENLGYAVEEGTSWSYNNADNNTQYGMLYNREAAEKACPTGWRLPAIEEWMSLRKLFPLHTYSAVREGGASGLNTTLGGQINLKGKFQYVNMVGYYWSSSPYGKKWKIFEVNGGLYKYANFQISRRDRGLSVRCIKE